MASSLKFTQAGTAPDDQRTDPPGAAAPGSPVRPVANTSAAGTGGTLASQDINGLLYGVAWASTMITYSFPASASFYGTAATYPDGAALAGFQPLSAAQQTVVRYALGLVSSYTGLQFTEIPESATAHAMIRLAGSSAPTTSETHYPGTTGDAGDAWYGNIRNDNPVKGSYAYDSTLHELGHALGLKHGQEDDGVHGTLPAAHNSTSWSIMDYPSYVGGVPFYENAAGSGDQTYMIDDIAALQYIYGANFSADAGNTVYTWSPTTGEEFIDGVGQGADATDTIYQAVWDGGGADVYDLSNYPTNLSIDLRPGMWSTFNPAQLADLDAAAPSTHMAPGNVANADEYNNDPRSLIEAAYGGSGNDTIIGNDADNTLRGGAGDDTLDGGAGTDTAVFSGSSALYRLTSDDDATYTMTGPDGTDTLRNIELLRFDNMVAGIQDFLTPYFSVTDTTAGTSTVSAGQDYAGPVSGLQRAYANVTPDNLDVTASAPNVFIHSGAGMDALNVASGNNVLDGATGSNFLVGGPGRDTFYMDGRNPASPVFSTVANFHAGDDATVWGVNRSDFTLLTLDGQGAAGYQGLDLIFTAPGHADTSFVLAGYTRADLSNGRLAPSYGHTQDLPGLPGSDYLTIHAA